MNNYVSWGQDFINRIKKQMLINQKPLSVEGYLAQIPDHEFQTVIGEQRHDQARSKLHDRKAPNLSRDERITLMELLFHNNTCGLHTSYWSRTWWTVKGGKFSQIFPTNAKLDAFERGERKI